MSSNFFLNIKINQLQEELDALATYTGYYWSFINDVPGIITSQNGSNMNFNFPSNNVATGHSSNKRNDVWSIVLPPNITAPVYNFAIGVSEDLSDFPSFTYPSMQRIKYGFGVINDQAGGTEANVWAIQSGIFNPSAFLDEYNPKTDTITLSYDGSHLQILINTTTAWEINELVLGSVYLVAGSFLNGGNAINVQWNGDQGGGGGAALTLEEVLNNGNNANNKDILNAGNITANKYLSIGGAISNTSQLHFLYGDGTSNGDNLQLVGYNSSDGSTLALQYYENNDLVAQPLIITQNSGLKIQSNTTTDGVVYDSIFNKPQIVINSVLNTPASGTTFIPANATTGIYNWTSSEIGGGLNGGTLYIKNLNISVDNSGSVPTNMNVLFWIGKSSGEIYNSTNPLNNQISVPYANPIILSDVILSYVDVDNESFPNGVFLNIEFFETGSTNTFRLNPQSLETQLTLTSSPSISSNPSFLV